MPKIRMITDVKRSLILLLITGLLSYLLQLNEIPAMSFLTIGLILFPILVLVSSAVGGVLTSAMVITIITITAHHIFSVSGLWFILYLTPLAITFHSCLHMRISFLNTVIAVFSTYLLSIVILFLIFQRMTGGNLYEWLAREATISLNSLPQRDPLLYTFWRYGLLSHGMEAGTQVFDPAPSGWTFKPEVLNEFYKQIKLRVSTLASGFIPGLMTTYAVSMSSLGTGFSVYLGKKQSSFPKIGMLSFSQWHIPKKWGGRLWVLALGYLLAMMTTNQVLSLAGQMMYNVFFSLYAIQGLAVLDYRMKAKNWRITLRIIILIILLTVLTIIPVFIGIIDQNRDSRKLRQQHAA